MSGDPLIEWNRLNKENAENAIANALFQTTLSSAEKLDSLSTWLLAGASATAALLISSTDAIMPLLTSLGFKACGAMLAISCFSGIVAKFYAVMVQISYENLSKMPEILGPFFDGHEEQEEKIQQIADMRGIQLNTDIDMDRIINIYTSLMPPMYRWLILKEHRKSKNNPHSGYVLPMRIYYRLISVLGFQAFSFLAFIVIGFWFAKPV